jgi:predicted dehydrogenase
MDVDVNKAVSLHQKWKTDYYTTDAEDIINDEKIDLVYIASNHASHAEYAIKAIEKGKAVHIEKPHAVDTDQLVRLVEAMIKYDGRVRLGFNRPSSKLGKMVTEYLMNEPGETMLNWFVAGHEIEPDHWYFSPKEGGRILGNLCHWTDLILQMIPPAARFPIQIHPVRSERSDCDIAVNFVFGDGSIASITFSAKGHTFEGVRETLNGHKGNVLVNLKDFKEVRIDVVEKVIKKKLWVRDHGHRNAVRNSYEMLNNADQCEAASYVWDTGYLVIKTKEALEKFEPVTVQSYDFAYAEEKRRLHIDQS